MIDALIRWSLAQRAAVLAVALIVAAVGVRAAAALPVDVFPDLTAPTVTVLAEAHGMAPLEVERQVTFPIEAALNGAPGVRRVRSSSAVGLAIVWAEFDWGADVLAARQVVGERLALAAAELPPELDRPVVAPSSSIMGEVMFLALTSDRHGPTELRTTADTLIRRRLLAVPGVSQVTPIGGAAPQLQVVLDPARLREQRVSVSAVGEALAESNENVSAGFMAQGGVEHLVTGVGRIKDERDAAETVIEARGGIPVRVRDLGVVRRGEGPRGAAAANGRPAVILSIQKQPGANTLQVTRLLDRAVQDLRPALPAGMTLDARVFRQADFIEVALRNVLAALRDGGVLVVLVVLLFLGDLRAAGVTLVAIPLSLLAAVLVLSGLGATINTMTLGGMAIAVGALVDDAIIDVENVVRRLRDEAARPEAERRPALQVVYGASAEVRGSIVFATLIIVLVFVPVFFLPGVEGRLLQPLGTAYVVALAASLLVALTVTPALALLLLPGSGAVASGKKPLVVRGLERAYAPLLDAALRRPWRVAVPALVAFVAAAAVVPRFGRAFLPEFDEGALTISVVTLPGTALGESEELGRATERALLAQPEVVSVARRTGRAELDEHAQGVEAAELDVAFKLKGRSKEALLADVRAALSRVPGVAITIGQPISHRIDHMLSGTRANIAIKIFGEELPELRQLASRVRAAAEPIRGVVDLSVEQQAEIPQVTVTFDRPALARHGLRSREVGHALEAALQGHLVSRVVEGQRPIDLVVRIEGGWTPRTLGDLPMDLPGGGQVPLRAVARVEATTGPNAISREAVMRKIVVQMNVAGRDVASVVAEAREAIEPVIAPVRQRGYDAVFGGQFEAAEAANRTLLLLGAAVVAGIGLLLYLAFGSGRDAALVMLNLPLALIGGVLGVALSGGVLSVASMIGFITVFGIAARNGIMLVSHVRHLQAEEGVTDLAEAVRRGALERLAPILMTALAAGLALVPLALGGGEPGNEIQTPMAIVILWGLLSSTVLNMLVVPTLYLRLGRPLAGARGAA
jgi:CzcA family heavy metal efflux pump